jgi:phosphoenolpyruvate-protein kinase (PTS system EI component)
MSGGNRISHSSILAISSKLPTPIGLVHPTSHIIANNAIAAIEKSNDEVQVENDSHQFQVSAVSGNAVKSYEENENWNGDDENPDVEGAFDLDL